MSIHPVGVCNGLDLESVTPGAFSLLFLLSPPFRVPPGCLPFASLLSHTPFIMGAGFSLREFFSSLRPRSPHAAPSCCFPSSTFFSLSASLIIAPFTFPCSGVEVLDVLNPRASRASKVSFPLQSHPGADATPGVKSPLAKYTCNLAQTSPSGGQTSAKNANHPAVPTRPFYPAHSTSPAHTCDCELACYLREAA